MDGMGAPRWLLLVALVLGVAGMHTLGHPKPGRGLDGMVTSTSAHGSDGPPGFDPHSAGQASDERLPGLDPMAVCLAILSSLALLVSVSATLRARLAVGELSGSRSWRPRIARPPPKRTAVRLARLSVLRT